MTIFDTRYCNSGTPHEPHVWTETGVIHYQCEGFRITPDGGAAEPWDRPGHYGGEENPFEPIKIIEYYDLNFNLGNAIKYVLRAPLKGTPLDDLRKAYTYIGFEIRRRERQELTARQSRATVTSTDREGGV